MHDRKSNGIANMKSACHFCSDHSKEGLLADLGGEGSELDISSILDESWVTVFPLLRHI